MSCTRCGARASITYGSTVPVQSVTPPIPTVYRYVQHYHWQCLRTESHRGESYRLFD